MQVSIIICTRNRADDLKETLRSLASVSLPEGFQAELLIVDNGSTDSTAAVVQAFTPPQLTVRYLVEARKGQCFARNAGLDHAVGQVILFTDDDVRVPPNWVTEMSAPILKGETDAVAGGVRLAPNLLREWQTPFLRAMLATSEYIEEHSPNAMIGANMAVGRHVLERVPRFDTELDPGAMGLGGDSLFRAQLEAAGYGVLPRRAICVEHHPDPSRLKHSSFLKAGENVGRFQGYREYHFEHLNITMPYLRLWRWELALSLWRLAHREEVTRDEGISPVELHYLMYVYRFKQFLLERKRPRNYEKRGLIKVHEYDLPTPGSPRQ